MKHQHVDGRALQVAAKLAADSLAPRGKGPGQAVAGGL